MSQVHNSYSHIHMLNQKGSIIMVLANESYRRSLFQIERIHCISTKRHVLKYVVTKDAPVSTHNVHTRATRCATFRVENDGLKITFFFWYNNNYTNHPHSCTTRVIIRTYTNTWSSWVFCIACSCMIIVVVFDRRWTGGAMMLSSNLPCRKTSGYSTMIKMTFN